MKIHKDGCRANPVNMDQWAEPYRLAWQAPTCHCDTIDDGIDPTEWIKHV